ncbi:MAG: hypothetical protein U0904_07860 [Candidatus Nanopelagicales bacterium]|nr:hypothetical protein [Candidatus Nanopelagicales bacterium]
MSDFWLHLGSYRFGPVRREQYPRDPAATSDLGWKVEASARADRPTAMASDTVLVPEDARDFGRVKDFLKRSVGSMGKRNAQRL